MSNILPKQNSYQILDFSLILDSYLMIGLLSYDMIIYKILYFWVKHYVRYISEVHRSVENSIDVAFVNTIQELRRCTCSWPNK